MTDSYCSQLGRYPLLTRSQEVQLAKRIEAGDASARRRLIECNLRLVATIARDYRTDGTDLADLIQEGTLGLIRAAERYDWRCDTKFSAYAAWWIRSAIGRALSGTGQPIRVPEKNRSRIADIRRARSGLVARLGRYPQIDEIADELALSPAQVRDTLAAVDHVSSLDAPLTAEGETSLLDVVPDPAGIDPVHELTEEESACDLATRLASLSERSRMVVEMRFGLVGRDVATLDEVAGLLGVARERARQLEIQAIRQLARGPGHLARVA